ASPQRDGQRRSPRARRTAVDRASRGAVDGDLTSLAYFLEVERTRYAQQAWQRRVFPFDRCRGQRVLEIGVGLGTDLAQFAKAGAICHAIDITDRHLEAAARN